MLIDYIIVLPREAFLWALEFKILAFGGHGITDSRKFMPQTLILTRIRNRSFTAMLIPFRLVSFMKDKHTDLVSK
jgi:hypothetical protein